MPPFPLYVSHEGYWKWLVEIKRFEEFYYFSLSLSFSWWLMCIMCACMNFCPHISVHSPPPTVASGQPLSNTITGRSTRPAMQEVRSSLLWNCLICFKCFRFLLPTPLDKAFTLGPVNHEWPQLPDSVAKYSFCFCSNGGRLGWRSCQVQQL